MSTGNSKYLGPKNGGVAGQGAGGAPVGNLGGSTGQSPSQVVNAAQAKGGNAAAQTVLDNAPSAAPGGTPISPPAPKTPEADMPDNSGSSGTASSQVSIPASTANMITSAILSGSGTPNLLNVLQNVTYHFRLFCANDLNLFSQVKPTSAQGYFNSIIPNPNLPLGSASRNNGITTVVIAESGSTIYNIQSVNFTSLIGPNLDTRNVNIANFTMVVLEPLGGSFLTALKAAADACQNYNFKNCFYYLELSFKGYDTNGNYVDNPFPSTISFGGATIPLNMQQGNRWIWEVQIVDIDIDIDEGGGTYTINMILSDGMALDDEIHAIPESIQVSGNTLSDYFANLGTALTKSWADRYGDQTVKYGDPANNLPFVTFQSINLPGSPYDKQNPGTFTLLPADPNANPQATKDIADTFLTGTIQPGTTIEQQIEAALSASVQGQALGLGSANPLSTTNSPTTNSPNECILFRVTPDCIITGYDAYSGRYAITLKYTVTPHYSQYPIISPSQAVAEDSSSQAITTLVNRGLLQKRYEYIYTGMNTEIIDFKISLNAKWTVQLPRFFGQLNSYDSVNPNNSIRRTNQPTTQSGAASQLNPKLLANNIQQKIINATNQVSTDAEAQSAANQTVTDIQDAQLQDSKTNSAALPGTAPVNSVPSLLQTEQNLTGYTLIHSQINLNSPNALQQAQTVLNNITNKEIADRATLTALQKSQNPEYNVATGSVTYAQNLVLQQNGKQTNTTFTYPITFAQNYKDSVDQTGTGFHTNTDSSQALLGAVLNQMYEFSANPLMSIDLTIKGDPYWLGETNLAKQVYLRQTDITPTPAGGYQDPQMYGDTSVILDFKIPYQASSSNQNFGAPSLSPDLSYQGVYRINQVQHQFANDGTFTQILSGVRMPLITLLNAQNLTTSNLADGSGDGTDSSASSAPASSIPAPATSNNPSAKPISSPIHKPTALDINLANSDRA